MWAKRSFPIWTFFGVVLATLVCSAIVGTQSVRAAAACTAAQCTAAQDFSIIACLHRGATIAGFLCPVNGATDDFFFACTDHHVELDDCVGHGPS